MVRSLYQKFFLKNVVNNFLETVASGRLVKINRFYFLKYSRHPICEFEVRQNLIYAIYSFAIFLRQTHCVSLFNICLIIIPNYCNAVRFRRRPLRGRRFALFRQRKCFLRELRYPQKYDLSLFSHQGKSIRFRYEKQPGKSIRFRYEKWPGKNNYKKAPYTGSFFIILCSWIFDLCLCSSKSSYWNSEW